MNTAKKIVTVISAGCFLASGAVAAQAFPKSGTLLISGDRGGYVIEYALRMLKLKQSQRAVAFRGSCDSACTLYLALPRNQVCVSPQSTFMFHMPYGATGNGNKIAVNYMMNSYPGWVKTWIRNKGGLSSQPLVMNYTLASKFLPTCATGTTQLRTAMLNK